MLLAFLLLMVSMLFAGIGYLLMLASPLLLRHFFCSEVPTVVRIPAVAGVLVVAGTLDVVS
jgi:hypothetical protein